MPATTTPVEPDFNPVLDVKKPNSAPLPVTYQRSPETLAKLQQNETPENQQKQAFLQGYRTFSTAVEN